MKELYLADLTEEERAELRAKRREARKEMERERKKAIRAAYKRVKDAKKKPDDVSYGVIGLDLLESFVMEIQMTFSKPDKHIW